MDDCLLLSIISKNCFVPIVNYIWPLGPTPRTVGSYRISVVSCQMQTGFMPWIFIFKQGSFLRYNILADPYFYLIFTIKLFWYFMLNCFDNWRPRSAEKPLYSIFSNKGPSPIKPPPPQFLSEIWMVVQLILLFHWAHFGGKITSALAHAASIGENTVSGFALCLLVTECWNYRH